MADFETWDPLILVSRKIWVTEKLCHFHTANYFLSHYTEITCAAFYAKRNQFDGKICIFFFRADVTNLHVSPTNLYVFYNFFVAPEMVAVAYTILLFLKHGKEVWQSMKISAEENIPQPKKMLKKNQILPIWKKKKNIKCYIFYKKNQVAFVHMPIFLNA